MKKTLFFLVMFFIVFAGCSSEKDCNSMNTDYTTYSYDEELDKCVLVDEIERDICGNSVQEEGETYCNCPSDVKDKDVPIEEGGCSGNKGEFLSYYCNDETNDCELRVTDKVKQNSKLISLRAGSDVEFEATVEYYFPFMIDRHNVEIDVLLKKFKNSEDLKVKNINLRKVYIVTTDDELLGHINVNEEMEEQYDNIKLNIPLDAFTFETFDIEKRNVLLKFLVNYDKVRYNDGEIYKETSETEEIQEIFETKLHIIDPDKKNEDLADTGGGWS